MPCNRWSPGSAERSDCRALIIQETTGYRLLITPDDLDAAAFGQRLRRARELIGVDDDAADRELTEALALWRDEALTDAGDGDYIRGYAARWAEDRLLAIKERADIHLRRGTGPELLGELEELVGDHPLDESLMILLLRSLVAAGRVPEALDRFEQLRSFLADQLGTDPGRELQELHLRLLRGEGDAPPRRRPSSDPEAICGPG